MGYWPKRNKFTWLEVWMKEDNGNHLVTVIIYKTNNGIQLPQWIVLNLINHVQCSLMKFTVLAYLSPITSTSSIITLRKMYGEKSKLLTFSPTLLTLQQGSQLFRLTTRKFCYLGERNMLRTWKIRKDQLIGN